ncbi:peroxisomal biogenesis factor 19-like [Xenia sp. Carnegie-2017]|uniref:peroxisomal biogenesis factor 19-like n=1 Tax=Xenia sp. Carnegie-2017 TaxID=2897299 RepID=UPI001F033FAF|nr:peroxisomal biogenesis factor 19-like [Xenia sp. Carnegie-2017]
MAEVESASEKNKDEDDDLDALLDSALEDFEKTPPSKETAKKENNLDNCEKTTDPLLEEWGLSESDIETAAAEFEKSMKSILGDDNELLREWNEFAGKATSSQESEVYENGSLSENAEAFEAHILKTMKGIAENAESIPGNLLDDEDNFLKAMANMGVDGHGPDFNAGVFPMMQGMMMNLLSKDVLYPALNELKTKYPTWLREKKDSLSSDVHENYSKQYELVCEICMEYESEKEKDTEDVKKKRFDHLMVLMQKMQRYGQPPEELVMQQGQEALFGGNSSGDKCPVM